MEETLTKYELHELDKFTDGFNHTFETIMFVEELNNCIIKYYRNVVYDYLLRKRFEKLHGYKLSDKKFEELIQLDYTGTMLFPSVGTGLNESLYIKKNMRDLEEFNKAIGFNRLEYVNIIDFLNKGNIGLFLKYENCVSAARELREMRANSVVDYINKVDEDIKKPEFSFIYQLHDFINRLNNYYLINDNMEQVKKLSHIKSEIKTID